MTNTKHIIYSTFIIILFHNFLFCQIYEPKKEILLKYKIQRYEILTNSIPKKNKETRHSNRSHIYNKNGLISERNYSSSDYTSKTVYQYNDNSILKTKLFFKNNSNTPASVNIYNYDELNNILEEIEFDSLENVVENSVYNQFKKVSIKKTFDPKFNSKLETTYTYDEFGLLISFIEVSDDGNTEISYFYEDTLKKKEECKWRSRHIWTNYYNYNENNNIISSHSRRKSLSKDYSTQFNISSLHLYKYNEENQLLKQKWISNVTFSEDVDDEIGIEYDEEIEGDITEFIYEYDERGLLTVVRTFINEKPSKIHRFNYYVE